LIEAWGRIDEGEHAGWYLYIRDDNANTGGFLIIRSPDKSFKSGYTDWVENRQNLDRFFHSAGWNVDWLET